MHTTHSASRRPLSLLAATCAIAFLGASCATSKGAASDTNTQGQTQTDPSHAHPHPQGHTHGKDLPVDATATAEMKDAQGTTIGNIGLRQAPNGVVLRIELRNVKPGERAFHIHEVGQCEPPFQSAGGHFNPFRHQHGIQNPEGKHAGDLPNLHVPESGNLTVEVFTDSVNLGSGEGSVFDDNGSSIIIHEGVDDYRSDPTGNAGGRYACGVIKKG